MVSRREFLRISAGVVGGLVVGVGGTLLVRPSTVSPSTTTEGGTGTVTNTATGSQTSSAVSNLSDLSTMIVGVNLSGADTLDPALTFDGDACWIPINNAYNHLLQWQYPDFSYVGPDTFTNISLASDNVTWTLTGLNNLKFSNGDTVTAADAAYSLQRAIQIGQNGLMGVYGGLISLDNASNVSSPDTNTLVFKVDQPAPPSLVKASMGAMPFAVVSQKMVTSNSTGASDQGTAWMNNGNSAGSGPFVIKEWVKDDHITMVANPNFVGPYQVRLKTVKFQHVADPNSELSLLKSGAIDVMWDPTPQQVAAEQFSEGINAEYRQQATTYMIWLNCAQPPFNNEAARQALKWAIDYPGMINNIIGGDGFPLQTISWNGLLGYDNSQPFSKSPSMVQQILSQAGISDLSFTMLYPSGEPLTTLAAPKIQSDMADCGIKVTLSQQEQSALSTAFSKGSFQALFWWEGGGLQHIANTLWISVDSRMKLFAQWCGYDDTTVQGMVDACRDPTLTDAEFAAKSLAVTQYALNHAPEVVCWQMIRQVMLSSSVQNLPVPFSRLNVDYGRAYKSGIRGYT